MLGIMGVGIMRDTQNTLSPKYSQPFKKSKITSQINIPNNTVSQGEIYDITSVFKTGACSSRNIISDDAGMRIGGHSG